MSVSSTPPAVLFALHGLPNHIRSANGAEFIVTAIQKWLPRLDITMLYIEPACPWENSYAESFHCRVRDEFLVLEEFAHLAAARRLKKAFRHDLQ